MAKESSDKSQVDVKIQFFRDLPVCSVSFSPPFSSELGAGYGEVTNKVIGLMIEYSENQPTQLSKNTNLTQKKINIYRKNSSIHIKNWLFGHFQFDLGCFSVLLLHHGLGTGIGGVKKNFKIIDWNITS